MRMTRRAVGGMAAVVVALAGCRHESKKINVPVVEEYTLPPNETRYNEPDTAGYRKPAKKNDNANLNSPGMGGMNGGGMNGGGPGMR